MPPTTFGVRDAGGHVFGARAERASHPARVRVYPFV